MGTLHTPAHMFRFAGGRRAWRARQRAFTLIEVLVVVVIVAIVASVMVLSINVLGRDTQVEDESRRLVALFTMIQEQAELENRDYGLRMEEEAYQFLRFDPRRGTWNAVDDDDLLRRRSLPDGVRPRLFVEAREVSLRPPTDRKLPWPPQVMILSSGDLTAFELKLLREDTGREATLLGEVDGTIEVKDTDGNAR
jgi:general secretion pathway protein H